MLKNRFSKANAVVSYNSPKRHHKTRVWDKAKVFSNALTGMRISQPWSMTAIQEFIFLALKSELYLAMGSDKFLLSYIIPAYLAAQKKRSHNNAAKLKLHREDSDEC